MSLLEKIGAKKVSNRIVIFQQRKMAVIFETKEREENLCLKVMKQN